MADDEDLVLTEVDEDGVATFTLNRPERRNAWTAPMENRYFDLLEAADADPAARGARFSTAFARRGLGAEYGMSWVLPRYVGVGHALDLLLSSRVFEADEAKELGLVNRVLEPGEV